MTLKQNYKLSQFDIHVYVLCNIQTLIQRSHASAEDRFNEQKIPQTNKGKKQTNNKLFGLVSKKEI